MVQASSQLDELTQAHAHRVLAHIRQLIAEHGPLSFTRFMQEALFAPGLGYYSAGMRKFGRDGDFVTAPELSPVFSHCVAQQVQQVLKVVDNGDVLEFGAGTGVMALEVLRELQRLDCLPHRYYILEVSADLKQRQQALFASAEPELASRVEWLSELPATFRGIMLGNEVLDAMPVAKFHYNNGVKEYFVNDVDGELVWQLNEPKTPGLIEAVKSLNIKFPNSYESEINLHASAWIASLADVLQEGAIVLIDYGFPQREYYHPDRNEGTIMCHFQHQAHSNPLINPGIQDITAHVDFTLIAQAAVDNGLTVEGFTTQAAFLINCGLKKFVHAAADADQYNINQHIKILTLPSEMGELFKAIAFSKNFPETLLGFAMLDQTERL